MQCSRRHSAKVRSAAERHNAEVHRAVEGAGAELRRPDKEKLQIFLKTFIDCLLSIAEEFWVYITGIADLVTEF